jgi:hypothetical protein
MGTMNGVSIPYIETLWDIKHWHKGDGLKGDGVK